MSAKIAIVTGASQGIGTSTAKALATAGFKVYAHYRTQPAELPAVISEQVRWWQADFANPASLEQLPTELAGLERVDALIHCAGVAELGPCAETSAELWQWHMNVNAIAPAVLTTSLLPQLRAGGATVIVVNSGAGQHTHPNWGAYSASKHAAKAWANALRAEEPELRISSVYPGRVATAMQAAIHEFEQREYDPSRYIQPETVAGTIVELVKLPGDAVVSDLSLRPQR